MSVYSSCEIRIESEDPFVDVFRSRSNLEMLGLVDYDIFKIDKNIIYIKGSCDWSLNMSKIAKQLSLPGTNVLARDIEETLGVLKMLQIVKMEQ